MGFRPKDVDEMSLWEFMACCDGYSEAHGGKESRPGGEGMDDDRMRELGIEGFNGDQ